MRRRALLIAAPARAGLTPLTAELAAEASRRAALRRTLRGRRAPRVDEVIK
jgi:hypothetical protein